MASRCLVSAFVIAACVGCHRAEPAGRPYPLTSFVDPELIVYQSLLADYLKHGDSIYVVDSTYPYTFQSPNNNVPPPYDAAVRSAASSTSRLLTAVGFTQPGVRLVPRDVYVAHGRLRALYEFSRVGFTPDSAHAAVYMANLCPLCGGGSLVLLDRDANGVWHEANSIVLWVSWRKDPSKHVA
jgi:hypothetical protein